MPIKDSQFPDFTFETAYLEDGPVFGVDESGRGTWAGPVSAAAFWIHPQEQVYLPPELTDSKKLSKEKRGRIEAYFRRSVSPHVYVVAHASVLEIDQNGILKATFLAMCRAIDRLAEKVGCPAMVLIDGPLLPPKLAYPGQAVVRGDSQALSIAAASIMAKQERDRIMSALHEKHPHYGWATNAGYGTKNHSDAIATHGITVHHRQSFAPIKAHLAKPIS